MDSSIEGDCVCRGAERLRCDGAGSDSAGISSSGIVGPPSESWSGFSVCVPCISIAPHFIQKPATVVFTAPQLLHVCFPASLMLCAHVLYPRNIVSTQHNGLYPPRVIQYKPCRTACQYAIVDQLRYRLSASSEQARRTPASAPRKSSLVIKSLRMR